MTNAYDIPPAGRPPSISAPIVREERTAFGRAQDSAAHAARIAARLAERAARFDVEKFHRLSERWQAHAAALRDLQERATGHRRELAGIDDRLAAVRRSEPREAMRAGVERDLLRRAGELRASIVRLEGERSRVEALAKPLGELVGRLEQFLRDEAVTGTLEQRTARLREIEGGA